MKQLLQNAVAKQKEIDEVMVIGATDDDGFLKLIGKKCEAFVAIDDNKLRKSIVKILSCLSSPSFSHFISQSSFFSSSDCPFSPPSSIEYVSCTA